MTLFGTQNIGRKGKICPLGLRGDCDGRKLTKKCSLIIINFDEHGGFADHIPPPVNIPAPEDGIAFTGISDKHNVTYDFTRLGIRSVPLSLSTLHFCLLNSAN